MYDKMLALDVLNRLHETILILIQRFEPVHSVEYFTGSAEGREKLDSICMLLIVIGETLKNLDKITQGSLLPQYPQVDWKKAKGLRDIISHHYFEVDAEQIFHLCRTHIEPMRKAVEQIIKEIS
jgi:uncharacterized protein with HEPN domain